MNPESPERAEPVRARVLGRVPDTHAPCVLGTPRPSRSGDEAKVKDWISKGAQPTDSVQKLLKAKGIS